MTDVAETYSRALAAHHSGDGAMAATLSLAALSHAPDHGPAQLLRAVSLPDKEMVLAAAHYASACRNAPHDADCWFNRAVFLERVGRLSEAMSCYRRALSFDPIHRGALRNGTQLIRIHEHFEDALVFARRMQLLDPDDCIGYTHEAISLQHLGELEASDAAFAEAVRRSSDPMLLQWEHHFSLLARERFAEAWEKYETRFACSKANGVDDMAFDCPRWDGKEGQHVLVYCEQGLGDQIMFASAIGALEHVCDKVSLAVSPGLAELFTASFPQCTVYSAQNGLDPDCCAGLLARAGAERGIDAVIPMGSLMTRFRNKRANFSGKPYLRASDEARSFWHQHLLFSPKKPAVKRKLRVGLCWASNPAPGRFFSSRRAVHKTMALDIIAPLAAIKGIEAVAVTNVSIEAFAGSKAVKSRVADVSTDLVNLDRTAALLESLDLLITVDTGVAHLAGALGVPVWILLSKNGDARWGLCGTQKSYWYRSARLFWQEELGDWKSVIASVGKELATRVDDGGVEKSA